MDISAGLIAKGTAGLATAAAATSGVIYKDNVVNFVKTGSFFIDEGAKRNSLGLPSGLSWPTQENTTTTTELSVDQLKTVNFEGKGESNVTSTGIVSLTIEKVSNADEFPEGFKFIFKPKDTNDVTITAGSTSIALKTGMDLEFKIKESSGKWSLERAWTVKDLGKKVGLNCENPASGVETGECSFTENKTISVYEEAGKKSTQLTVTDANNKKMTFSGNKKITIRVLSSWLKMQI